MRIQVLISTYMDSIARIPGLLKSIPTDIEVLIIHQVAEGQRYNYDALSSRVNVQICAFSEKGLALSRNRAASLATGDILIPTDDDIEFLPGAFQTIESAFLARPDALVCTFQAITPDQLPYKKYSRRAARHSLNSIRRVSSIEIAVRRPAFTKHQLAWDLNFGLNAQFGGGLELAFMKNVLDLELPAYYVPERIVVHPRDSTGHRHSSESAYFRGAIYSRLYGGSAYILLAIFALLNAWRAGSISESFRYVSRLYRGAHDHRRLKQAALHSS
jgi:glycosyltransferase involved in cell wall biosynthesis